MAIIQQYSNVQVDHTFKVAKTRPFMSALHEEIFALEWSCLYHSSVAYDPQQFMGVAYVGFSPDAYMSFMTQDGFDFVNRRDFDFVQFHIAPMDALVFRAYTEA